MCCKTCRYWQESNDVYAENKLGFKKCTRIREKFRILDTLPDEIRWGRYENKTTEEKFDAASKELFNKEKAYTQDASDYIANLMTSPYFGCVLHEDI